MMKKEGKVKFNIFKLALKILYNILIIFCIILIAIILMQKITDSNRSVAGFRIFRVVTGSMVPKYNIGEVVICKETNPDDIKIGDSIVYRGRSGQFSGKAIMHDVIGKDYSEDNGLTFHVKGLANNEEDPEVRAEQIYGVVKHESWILTALYQLATSIYSAFIIVTLLVINVFVSFKGTAKKRIEEQEEILEDENEEPDDEEPDDEEPDDEEPDEENDEEDTSG